MTETGNTCENAYRKSEKDLNREAGKSVRRRGASPGRIGAPILFPTPYPDLQTKDFLGAIFANRNVSLKRMF